ncbi:MAG: hypothetical protein LIO97_03010 [Tannerellaceae bacterium]|nr:hypothetical protein [Tannerellaceae bacterium]
MTSFFEQELFTSQKEYNLYFSGILINNEPVTPLDNSKILSESLPFTTSIKLKHRHNNLSISFSSNSYVKTLTRKLYEYKLEGFDEKWIPGTTNQLFYTNLNPGKYLLKVREKQSDPTTIPKSIELAITIQSSLYATPLFYFLYILIISGIVYSIFRFKQSKLLLKTSLTLERKEKEQIEALNQNKLQFFANISHEFRTPLTLIITQIEILLKNNSLPPGSIQ